MTQTNTRTFMKVSITYSTALKFEPIVGTLDKRQNTTDSIFINRDDFSHKNLCNNCDHSPCCTSSESPMIFLNDIQKIKKFVEPTIKFYEEKTTDNIKINILKKKKNPMNVFSGITEKTNAQSMSIGLLTVKCSHLTL